MRWPARVQSEILIPLLAFALRLLPGVRTVDDAYITFRYAQNLVSGQGLVYNPGEHTLGTTTPLYAALMAGLSLPFGGREAPFPILALILNALADALSCWLLIKLAERLSSRKAGVAAAALWAAAPMSVTFAIGGMETSVFITAMLATLYMYSSERPVLAAGLAGLSLLIRPDALLFIAPLAIARLWGRAAGDSRRKALGELTLFLAPLALWSAISIPFYGTPLPHSLLAKAVAYHLPREAALVRLLQHYATPFFGQEAFGNAWIGIGLLLYPSLFLMGSRRWALHWKPSIAISVYPLIYLLAFAVANPLIFRWYLAPPLPIYFLGIFAGAGRVLQREKARLPFALLLALATTLTANAWTLTPDHGPDRPAPKMAFIQLEELYAQVAARLSPKLLPEDAIAAGDIGTLGYFTQARILDTVGLISPAALAYYPLPSEAYIANYAMPAELILDRQPRFVVFLEVYGRNTLLADRRFNAAYEEIEKLPTDIYGSNGMLVYERR